MQKRQPTKRPAGSALTGQKTLPPLTESPMATGRGRDWASMGDDGLLAYCRKFIEANSIRSISELHSTDPGMCKVLRARGLIGRVGIKRKKREDRPWRKLSDGELVAYARRFLREKGITTRRDLKMEDQGFYVILKDRGLLDSVGLKDTRRRWETLSDGELIAAGKAFIQETGISSRWAAQKRDGTLYQALSKRGLLDNVGLKSRRRRWGSDGELVAHARRYRIDTGVEGRDELLKTDSGLYAALLKRGLLDDAGFHQKRANIQEWKRFSDEELVSHARRFMEKEGIVSRYGLERENRRLYCALWGRGLLEDIGLGSSWSGRRDWKHHNDEELVAYARRLMADEGVGGRGELSRMFKSLHYVLWKRGLIDKVFREPDHQLEEEAVRQIVDALVKF